MHRLKFVFDAEDSQISRSPFRISYFSILSMAMIIVGVVMTLGFGEVMAQRPMGIDVSSYQGSSDTIPTNINWTKVKSAGISFAWAKATEGTYYIDADFTYNEANAKAAGVPIGAYHFCRPDLDTGTAGADTEAAYFWNQARNYVKGGGAYLMPMLDAEQASPGTQTAVSAWVNEWCQDVVNYGTAQNVVVKPIVYTYTSWASDYLNSSDTQWPLWMASPNGENSQTGAPNSTTPWSTWTFWQYGGGTVSGVEGAVDEDVFNGTATTLQTLFVTTLSNAPAISSQPQSAIVTLSSNETFSVVASAYPAPTYQWKFDNTNIVLATSSNYTVVNAQTKNAGSYTVVVSNSLGVVTSSVAVLTVYIPLAITTQPKSLLVDQGSNATFTVSAIGTPSPAYQWQFNDVSIPTATNSSLALVNVQMNKQGTYTVAVSNSSGSILSSNATLTVGNPPSITNQPSSVTVSQGSPASFAVGANGTATLTYQWQLGGSNIAGATASAYSIASAQPSQAGNYLVVITNIFGSVTSAVKTLTVVSPPVIAVQPQSKSVFLSSNATFTVTATGTSLTYKWLFNASAISGATASSYTVSNAQTNNAGSYSVVITNIAGSMTSSNAVLTVILPQPPQFQSVTILSNGIVQMVLQGQSGGSYEIDSSSNLLNWVQFMSFVMSNTTYQFSDPSSATNSASYYRAKLVP
jgi:GH25 family lysozyme M1 (1,4-beta-N-acetylmuramidase)/uncharacterized protein YpmS